MTSIKRLTALVTIVVFMFSMFAFNAYADSTFTDVTSDTQYADAIEKLYKDGIVDGYLAEDGTRSFKPLDTITRGEFAKLLVVAKIKNLAADLKATSSGFADVDSDPTVSWTIPYIDYAVKASIVNGYEDGTFRAKNTVSYAEAVKMIVCSMGYASVIEKTEPWYDGYIKVAQQIGILNQAAGSGDDPAPRGLVAQLICNMTTSNKEITVVPGGNTGGGFVIKNDEDDEEESAAGMVTAVFNQGVEGETSGSMDEIKIYDESSGTEAVYKIGDLKIDDMYKYLGQYIDVTYTVKNSKRTIKSISTDGFNATVEMSADDIENVYETYIEYYKSESTKVSKISFASNMKIIYNGVGVSGLTGDKIKTLLDIDNGTLKFVDGDDNGKFDTAYVSSYETFFVGTSESTSKTITDKYVKNGNVLKSIKLDMDAENIEYKTSTGTSASFGSIRQNSVVSIAMPYDTSATYAKTTVIISTATAQGTVNSIDSSDDSYEIGDKTVKASQYYLNLIQQEPTQEMNRGDVVTCYLDHEGKVVAISATDTTKYGYIVDVISPEGSNKDDVKIRMVAVGSSTPSDYELKSTVKINGNSYSPRDVADVLAQSAAVINEDHGKTAAGHADNATYSQPIIFKTTSGASKVISTMTTVAANDETDCLEYELGATIGNAQLTYRTGNYFQDASAKRIFNLKFTSSSTNSVSTKVFFVPDDRSEEDEYSSYSAKPGKFTDYKKFNVDAFNVDPTTKNAEIVVVYGGTALEVNGSTKAVMVKEIKDVINKNNDKAKKIYYYDLTEKNVPDKKVHDIDTDGVVDVSDLKCGDIIKFATKDSLVGLVEKVFADGSLYNLSDGSGNQSTADWHINHATGTNTDHYNAYYGVVYSFDGGQLQLVKTADVEGINQGDADYDEKISQLPSKTEVLDVSSSAKVAVVDSSAKNSDDIILFYENAESVINSIINNGIDLASKIFASRNDDDSISTIVIFK
ncbi:MAG: S-layer homology domain-containing protein [Clostridia bacterium]|nr:S-layer homology domain-containing protein [Clostridia bacterium]